MFIEMMRLQMQTARMLAEANQVIGLRMMGLAGVTRAAPGENLRMVTEKQAAFAQSGAAMMRAFWSGRSPAAIYGAALRPIGRRTRANSRRLTRRP